MRAYVISIGDELLNGKVINWNGYWIAKRLTSMGINVIRIVCVADNEDEIIDVIKRALNTGIDYIFTTGGLGPTPGDITVEAVAKAVNKKVILHDQALKFVERRYRELYELGLVDSPELNESRRKMAMVPEGAIVIYNDVGVAPGIVLEIKKTKIFMLPGVPSEALYLFEKMVPYLKREKKVVLEAYVNVADESVISKIIEQVRSEFSGVNIKTYPIGFGQTSMRVLAIGSDKKYVEEALKKFLELVSRLAPPL